MMGSCVIAFKSRYFDFAGTVLHGTEVGYNPDVQSCIIRESEIPIAGLDHGCEDE